MRIKFLTITEAVNQCPGFFISEALIKFGSLKRFYEDFDF